MEEKENWGIHLSLDEFEHITTNAPGTCDCELCTKYWDKVRDWLKYVDECKLKEDKNV